VNQQAENADYEFDSPHINAPLWPWSLAGYSIAAFLTGLFLYSWLSA
jgi:hypothetical protein